MKKAIKKRPNKAPRQPTRQPLTEADRPHGTPDWLWARVLATGRAYDAWARRTFQSKLRRYLKDEEGQDTKS